MNNQKGIYLIIKVNNFFKSEVVIFFYETYGVSRWGFCMWILIKGYPNRKLVIIN